jgi:AcrR family transcriptional regulator
MAAERPKSDNPEREKRILDAAERLIIRYGYDKTTVSDIAEEAAVSKGAIYLHFDSKEELFDALFMREMLRYSEVWLQLIDADPQGGTFAGIYKNTLYAMQKSDLITVLFRRDKRVLGAYARRDMGRFGAKMQSNVEFLTMMQQAGAVRQDIKPDVIAHIMNMLSYGLVGMDDVMPAEDIPPASDLIEGIAELLDRALTPPDGGSSEAGKQIIRTLVEAARQQLQAKPVSE